MAHQKSVFNHRICQRISYKFIIYSIDIDMTSPIKIKRALRLSKKYDALQVFINREVPPSVEAQHKIMVAELCPLLCLDIDSFDAHLRQCNEHLNQMICVSPW